MKKQLACALILFTIIFSLSSTALAADTKTNELYPYDITVDMPADWEVFTGPDFDEALCQEYFGLSAEEMKAGLLEYNIYLHSVDKNDTDRKIYILIFETSDTDYNELSKEDLNAEAESFMDFPDNTFTGYSIYENGNITYLTYDYYDSETYYKEYVTVHDGYHILFTAACYSGAIEADQAQVLKGMVDSTIFAADVAAAAKALPIKIVIAAAVLVLVIAATLFFILRAKKKRAAASPYAYVTANLYNPQPFQPQPAQEQSPGAVPIGVYTAPAAHVPSQPVYTPPAAPQPTEVGPAPMQTAPASSNEISEKLSLLKELFDSGIITEEEFAAKRVELLEKL